MSFSASSDDLPPLDIPAGPTPVTAFSPAPPAGSSSSPASPLTHPSRPQPVSLSTKLVKSRTDSGDKAINGRRILKALGEGATAEVSLCEDTTTGEKYALKKMSKRTLTKQREYSQGPMGRPKITTGLDKVRREIDIMSALWHPNVVVLEQIIDDPDEDPLILVLEYAAHGQIMAFDSKAMKYKRNAFANAVMPAAEAPVAATAAEHDAPLPEHILRKLLADVLNGLEYLHSLRIVHRDVKPENILLGAGAAKLADFGVARRFAAEESTDISETHGTYHFFSPEMTTGDRYSAFKQDIWALGLSFYILATGGIVPFMSEETTGNPQELFNRIGSHRTGSLHFPSEIGVSQPLQDLLNRIMDADPNTRLTIDQIRNHPFMSEATSPLVHDLQTLSIASPAPAQ